MSILPSRSAEKITSSLGAVDLPPPQAAIAIVIANNSDATLNILRMNGDGYFLKSLFISCCVVRGYCRTNPCESKPTNRGKMDVVDGYCEFEKFSRGFASTVITNFPVC